MKHFIFWTMFVICNFKISVTKGQIDCDTIASCKSIVTDTCFNPYITGVLGNWRQDKTYTHYASRTESDPGTITNIRTNGTFQRFAPFWNIQDQQLRSLPDTAHWVWNSQITTFNPKGLEIQNKDPLGRYNSGLYGYGEHMPTAVIQNGRHRESAFEGFEDYNYSTQDCSENCTATRHFDFSNYKSRISTNFKHTGKSSLRLNGSAEQAGIVFRTVTEAEDSVQATLTFTTKTSTCVTNALDNVKASPSILLPAFSPLRGKRMVISAWVKEEQACNCITYTNNHIQVHFGGGVQSTFSPSGPIIEGWQRYEGVFDIPDTATSVGISLEPLGSTTVYYDDIRIHPYNANMKSFVYNPIDLRLMAELDENNYASFYEYDDDGTLIRVKKETQRGIKTIKETRSALTKE